ncbi:hypothetical protein [Flavobacterium sp. S87F.05.LMB.W.Kidney.N]|uniref:hypothetical protein n=1 Tax=Flavobacterium sp. S87F.05.LMB.W.Kidney.N TaxID=1278758 RepID=UPI001066A322|nr:hypothetical protein [Flavobacterium sp. S87F.05.LMB.W.Kidney.N]TDX09425.1 hypothetical protein EDB96_3723 [Flavobacterium sp. S87F.05.LMB.W.Kidney.N]
MENQYCYIEFDFTNEGNFKDLKATFEVIKDSKNNSIERDDKFWIEAFPKYSLEKFTFLDSDLKPNFDTAEETELSWHFYSLIELLSINYEIEYINLKETSHNKGIFLYDAYSYPYGGINGLIVFLESFSCNPKIYDDGAGVYNYSHEELNKTKKSKWNFSSLKSLFKTAMLLLFISLIASCNNKEKDLQFEKEVFYEVYPALIDSVWVNAVLNYVPPAPPGIDPSEYKLNRRNESNKRFNKELAEFKQKKFPVDLVFFDEVVIREHYKELQEHYKDAVISKNNVADTLEYKLDRKKLDAYTPFHLKYVSRIPRGNNRKFYNECCYSVRGIVILSRIQFDDEKKYGVLTAGIECGAMCGYEYLIYIKKVNDKWVIDKIDDAWIA